MTNFSQNITKSLFSLINTNKGLFKSEKQASFILSSTADMVHVAIQRSSFGENEGCIRVVEYTFFLDTKGVALVKKVSKTTGKTSIYFDRNNQKSVQLFANKQQLKSERQTVANQCKVINNRLTELENIKKSLSEETSRYVMTLDASVMMQDVKLLRLVDITKAVNNNIKRLEGKYSKLIKQYDSIK